MLKILSVNQRVAGSSPAAGAGINKGFILGTLFHLSASVTIPHSALAGAS